MGCKGRDMRASRWQWSVGAAVGLAILGPGMALTGCESAPRGRGGARDAASAGDLPHCVVCEYNADLACLEVDVTAETPRTEYDGKTYYFCSEECRAAFQKKPHKYVRGPQSADQGSLRIPGN
ncbi:hypothetical protein PHYC_03047 [Phycisphaerales bacterium]|nr:hypothetical protein PHYC_03047 [Phycisphaerales bacterium]